MKYWLDSIKMNVFSNKTPDEFKNEILIKIENSKVIQQSSRLNNDSLFLASKELVWLIVPPQPKYRIEIKFISRQQNISQIKIKGSFLVFITKYFGLLLSTIFIIELLCFSFKEVSLGNSIFLLGPIIGAFILNYINRVYIKTALEDFKELVSNECYTFFLVE